MESKNDESQRFIQAPPSPNNSMQENLVNEVLYMRLARGYMYLTFLWNYTLILISITFMSLFWPMKCDENIQAWLLSDTIYLFLNLILKSYMYGYNITPDNILNHPYIAKLAKFLPVVDFCVFVYGCYLFTSADPDCVQNSPYLYYLAVTMFTYSWVMALLPIALLVLLCCCAPCLILGIRYFSENRGATQQEIDGLPVKKCDRIEAEYGCSICKEDYTLDIDLTVLPCKHEFHPACVNQWLAINKTCPLCRASITAPV